MLLATRHDDELEAALADPEAADRAEIRLAVVMTGGVSLAVWIGGVVAEIYRAHKRVGLYKPLLDALRSDVTIDIVTGASAGGLNGVFLGAALSRQVDVEQFDGLRDVWLTAGSMIALLRDPYQRNPPSLLKGDAYLLVEIEKVLRGWLKWGKNQFKAGQQFDLVLTATTLAPDIVQRADDLGARIAEPVHRARFHFQASHFNAPAPDTLARQMALAARTSASFPGAFEPSYVGIGRDSAYADMAGIASFPQSMWAMDGGVLMNKPVAPALDLLRDRRSVRHGRRILLYVNPDPSDGAVTQEA
ncbi:MAG: hypothetical protein QOD72_2660, partial [Acidimicrobiaceae bacterium]|nr:hypothetical protein [Acidimicrobiaceae bacterium]